MSISAGTILRVVAILAWDDAEIMQNVFSAAITGGADPYDADDVVAEALAWVGSMYVNLVTVQSDELNGSEIRVYEYDSSDDDWDEVGSDSFAYTPTTASEQLPRGVAGLINCKTGNPDINGKKYVGGITEGGVDDGLLNAATLAALAAFGADWVAPFVGGTTGADWTPGIWSPTHTTYREMTGALLIPAVPAYQRRRKRGVGI